MSCYGGFHFNVDKFQVIHEIEDLLKESSLLMNSNEQKCMYNIWFECQKFVDDCLLYRF